MEVKAAVAGKPSNQNEVTVRGIHFMQEDSPHEIGLARARFVRQTRAAPAIPG
jgi:haloalkane dehalogenase